MVPDRIRIYLNYRVSSQYDRVFNGSSTSEVLIKKTHQSVIHTWTSDKKLIVTNVDLN